ncbi:TPA: hypothetical protein R1B06_004509 [Escherichia coli]|nr:hypothetical protein [Escherichia coli]HDC5041502.1 hypothetical protein [Escherichia coli]HEB9054785.1 hypothetical protein [Escherichia coli]
MKALFFILCFAPISSFASNDSIDHVFFRAFQAAMATSLCSDVFTVADDNSVSKELEPIIKLCKERGDQSRAILEDYTNAEHI